MTKQKKRAADRNAEKLLTESTKQRERFKNAFICHLQAMNNSVREKHFCVGSHKPEPFWASELNVLCRRFHECFISYLLIINRTQKFCVGERHHCQKTYNICVVWDVFIRPGIHFSRLKAFVQWVAFFASVLAKH